MERIEIYTSKRKSLLLLICSIALVAIGVSLLLEVDNMDSWRARNPSFTRGIGITSIILFGFGLLWIGLGALLVTLSLT